MHMRMASRIGLIMLLLLAGCDTTSGVINDSPPREESAAPVPPSPAEGAVFRIWNEEWGNLGYKTPTTFTIRNIGDRSAVPQCILTAPSYTHGRIVTDLPSLAPGSSIDVDSYTAFPVPLFNTELNGSPFGVRCFEQLPRRIERSILRDERVARPGRRVVVPPISGKQLYLVGTQLLTLGLRVRLDPSLHRGQYREARALRGILHLLVEYTGPRVDVIPPPGTELLSGDTVTLVPASR